MRRMPRGWQAFLAACALLASLVVPLCGQEKRAAAPVDQEILDRQISAMLRVVIDTGADIHNGSPNQGIPHNPAGCYRLWHDFLVALRPLLADHPDLQTALDVGLAETERMPSRTNRETSERAHALRKVIDTIRAGVGPQAAAKQPGQIATLWEQLGGETAVRQIVDEWVALAGPDPKVNFNRGGKIKLTDPKVAELKNGLVAYLSQITRGPIKYQGKTMKEVHQGMGITNAEFDAALADLRKAMEARAVKPLVIQDVLKLVGATRGDIVEVKQEPDEKNLDKKKTEEKKSRG
jgi:hemoglobin